MPANTDDVTAAALALPEDDRLELADRLMESLEGPPDEDYEQAWADEIARRLADVRSGKSVPIPWDEARKRIFEDLDGDDR